MSSRNIRDISPILQKWRNFLLGRQHTLALRFQDDLVTRSPPLPDLPDGPSHNLSCNYYYTRDARKDVMPPEVIHPQQKLLEKKSTCLTEKKRPTPGPIFYWD